jgi:hypothetical protein
VGSNPTLSAFQEFSKGLVRPDPLLYLGFWRVFSPRKSALSQGGKKVVGVFVGVNAPDSWGKTWVLEYFSNAVH